MAFDVSSLGNYTKQALKPLLTSAVFGARTQQLMVKNGILLTKVKSAEAIPILDTDAVFQTDSCSFDPSGTTSFTQRTVTVGKIKLEEKICPKDLETKFTQEALNAGSTYEDFGNSDFEKVFQEKKSAVIAKQLESAIWMGDTGSGTNNLKFFDGLSKQIIAGSPIDANVSGYTGIATVGTGLISSSNILAVIKGCKNAIPAALKGRDDLHIFCGYDLYDLYVDAGIAANYFHFSFDDKSNYEMTIPGTNIKLTAVHGLDNTGKLFATYLGNMALAVDVEAEETNYKLWYSQDNNDVRFRCAFKMGTNVAFTNLCVKFVA